jgi:O-antigen ligase
MYLFLFLISLMPFMRHPLWGAYVGQFTMLKYVGLACVLYAALHVAANRRFPSYLATFQARFFAFFFISVCFSYWTSVRTFSWEYNPFITYASFLLLFFITLPVVDSLFRLRLVLLTIIGAVAWGSLYVIREWQKFHTLYANFRAPGWVVGDSNYFAVSALISVPLALCLFLEGRRRWEKAFCLASLLVTTLALILGASRGGYLGLIAVSAVLVQRSTKHARYILPTLVLLGAIAAVPSSPIQRLLRPQRSDDEAVAARTTAWKAGIRMIRSHPLTGVGIGNFKSMLPAYVQGDIQKTYIAHNTYIEIAAETGVPSLLLFFAVLYFTYRTLEDIRRRTARHGPLLLRNAALGLQAGFVGCLVALFFLSGESHKLFWLTIFLSMCLPYLLTRSHQAASSVSSSRSHEVTMPVEVHAR